MGAGPPSVIEDARLWMPEDARYRVVRGPRWDNARRGCRRGFLTWFLLPRRETDSSSAPWVFCYGCDLAALGRRLRGPVRRRQRRDQVRADAPMTLRAIVGLIVLQLLLPRRGRRAALAVSRGWRTWPDSLRLAGVAIPARRRVSRHGRSRSSSSSVSHSGTLIDGSGVALAAGCLAGAAAGARRPRPRASSARWAFPRRLRLGAAVFVARLVRLLRGAVPLRAPRRALRLGRVVHVDSRRRRRYFHFGGLEACGLRRCGPFGRRVHGYPPGLPPLQAASFHAMGSADVVTLNLQLLVPRVGFAGPLIGLLADARASACILLSRRFCSCSCFPDIRKPRDRARAATSARDTSSRSARFSSSSGSRSGTPGNSRPRAILLGGAMLTKREGILSALCIVVAALVATYRGGAEAWPRIGAMGAAAFALALPWRVWFMLESLPSDAPEEGYLGVFDQLDRAWPSHELVLRALFDYDLWLLRPDTRDRGDRPRVRRGSSAGGGLRSRLPRDCGRRLCLVTFWSNSEPRHRGRGGPREPRRRYAGAGPRSGDPTPPRARVAWAGRDRDCRGRRPRACSDGTRRGRDRNRRRTDRRLPGNHGLPSGGPRFPSPEDCVLAPVAGQQVRVVFGYRATLPEAIALRDRALEVGFEGTEAAQDGCGRARVSVDGVPSIGVGQEVMAAARTVDLDPSLELDPDG